MVPLPASRTLSAGPSRCPLPQKPRTPLTSRPHPVLPTPLPSPAGHAGISSLFWRVQEGSRKDSCSVLGHLLVWGPCIQGP